jgi:hypothetical protein
MRRPLDCPRERLPVTVELELDGGLLARLVIPASGLSHDRASSVYHKYVVPAGRHRLVARLRDSARPTGFDYERAADIELDPRENFVVDFSVDAGTGTGGFTFHGQ